MRELAEFQKVFDIAEEFNVEPASLFASATAKLNNVQWMSGQRRFTPEQDDPNWFPWRRRYQWLKEHLEWAPPALYTRALLNEYNREIGNTNRWIDSEEAAEMFHRLHVETRNEYIAYLRRKGAETPTPEELIGDIESLMWSGEIEDQLTDADPISMGNLHRAQMRAEAHLAATIKTGGRGSGYKIDAAESDLQQANYDYVGVIQEAATDLYYMRMGQLKDEINAGRVIGTWAEERPEVYGEDAITAAENAPLYHEVEGRTEDEVYAHLDRQIVHLSPDDISELRDAARRYEPLPEKPAQEKKAVVLPPLRVPAGRGKRPGKSVS
jgi:hypothetical protein